MSIANLGSPSYTEQQGVIALAPLATVTGAANYGNGSITFAVTDHADSGDILALGSAANVNALGAISVSGSAVYLGQGSSRTQIGTVDAVNDGQGGRPLQVHFDNVTVAGTSPVLNGDFSQGLTGWTTVSGPIDLGVTTIAGWATPEAPLILYPSQTPGGNDNDLSAGYDNPQVVISGGRLLLQETSLTSTSFGVVHGPAAYSDTFHAAGGMVLKFDWQANKVADDYHVVGYLLNTTTGQVSIALQGWGATGSGVGTVSVPADGDYRFVFVSGSFDATGGRALGASMYIDNIRVEAPALGDSVLQSLVRQVTYQNTSDAPGSPVKTVTVTTSDFGASTSTATLGIAVTPVNDAPVGSPIGVVANGIEDVAQVVSAATLLAGFSDPDGDALSVVDLRSDHVAVTDNGNGTFTLTPEAEYSGSVLLAYTVSDGHGGTRVATRSFEIAPAYDAPQAVGDDATVGEDSSGVAIAVLANDTDVDPGDTLSVVGVDATGTAGTVAFTATGVSYTPSAANQSLAAGQTATDSFSYTVQDSSGARSRATVHVTVVGANDAPLATDDSAQAGEDGSARIAVLANDSDIDAGDVLRLRDVQSAAHGTVQRNPDGTITYTPGAEFQSLASGQTGSDSFQYTMMDSAGAISGATVTVTVVGANDAPVAAADSLQVGEDGSAGLDVLANDSDVDAGDHLVLVSGGAAGAGSVALGADGQVHYTPGASLQSLAAGQFASDSFEYTLADASGAISTGQVSVTIAGANDAPVAAADAAQVGEDGSTTIDVRANDTDIDSGDTVQVSQVGAAAHGTVQLEADGTVRYTPGTVYQSLAAGQTATDSFSYTLTDSAGASSSASVTVTVIGANDAPVASVASGPTQAVAEGRAFSYQLPAGLFTDVDGDTLVYSATADGGSLPGWLAFDSSTGSFHGTPGAGSDYIELQVRATDPSGAFASYSFALSVGHLYNAGNGKDVVVGGRGNDTLLGGNGVDRLDGGAGDDRIAGGRGNDMLTGGSGRDTFVMEQAGGSDTITDFQVGVDHLELVGTSFKRMAFSDTNKDGAVDCVLTLDNGSVTLLGVSSVADANVLFA
jgi:VCBS repeat-containing protein